MHNAKVNGLSIGYKQDDENDVNQTINLSSKQSEHTKTDTVITVLTGNQGWSFKADDVDLFCKELKKFVEQATGKKKKQADIPENVATGHGA